MARSRLSMPEVHRRGNPAGAPLNRRLRILVGGARLTTEGLSKLLEPEFDVVGRAFDSDMVEEAWRLRPDALVVDLTFPALDDLEAVIRIRRRQPSLRAVLLLDCLNLTDVRIAMGMDAGGYISKMDSIHVLTKGIQEVVQGHTYVSDLVRDRLRTGEFEHVSGSPLTERQEQVLQLVSLGKTRKEIAEILQISPKTVEFHKSRIMGLLGIRTTAELTRYSVGRGFASDMRLIA